MQVKTKAIVISALKFQEKSLIVKCFTLSHGLKSYFVRDAFSSRKSNQKVAYFQPLNILTIEAVHKNKGALEHFKAIEIDAPFHSIHTDLVKGTMVLFIAEILYSAIREEEKNERLFIFLETALHWLDTHTEIANFHLILLIEMTKYFGFYPEISSTDKPFFSLTEGTFSSVYTTDMLDESQTYLFKKLMGLKWDTGQKVFHITERQLLLKVLMDYYGRHLEGFRYPKSLEVLKEVFS